MNVLRHEGDEKNWPSPLQEGPKILQHASTAARPLPSRQLAGPFPSASQLQEKRGAGVLVRKVAGK